MVTYRTLEIAVYKMLKETPEKYKFFKETMINIFKNNFNDYLDIIENMREFHGKTEKLDLWRLEVLYDINHNLIRFKQFIKDGNTQLY